jgi:hypothetical protein
MRSSLAAGRLVASAVDMGLSSQAKMAASTGVHETTARYEDES